MKQKIRMRVLPTQPLEWVIGANEKIISISVEEEDTDIAGQVLPERIVLITNEMVDE